MTDAIRTILQVVVGTGATAVLVRYMVKQAVQHFLDTEKLKLAEELKRVSKLQETKLELWSQQQSDLFKHLIEEKAIAIQHLVKDASFLRRAIHGVGEERNANRVNVLFHSYQDSFDEDQILPRKLHKAAHDFKDAAEKMIGACVVAGSREPLDEVLVKDLDNTYAALLAEARSVVLPAQED
jgi:hypothetical protein